MRVSDERVLEKSSWISLDEKSTSNGTIWVG
jgi:hypothetical protein